MVNDNWEQDNQRSSKFVETTLGHMPNQKKESLLSPTLLNLNINSNNSSMINYNLISMQLTYDSNNFTPSPPSTPFKQNHHHKLDQDKRNQHFADNDVKNILSISSAAAVESSSSEHKNPNPIRRSSSKSNRGRRNRNKNISSSINYNNISSSDQHHHLQQQQQQPSTSQTSISLAVQLCHDKILRYYDRFVTLIGWRPLIDTTKAVVFVQSNRFRYLDHQHDYDSNEYQNEQASRIYIPQSQTIDTSNITPNDNSASLGLNLHSTFCCCWQWCYRPINWLLNIINYLYIAMILSLLLSGYLLQYATCFRVDSIDSYTSIKSSLLSHNNLTTNLTIYNPLDSAQLNHQPSAHQFITTTNMNNKTKTFTIWSMFSNIWNSLQQRYYNVTFHNLPLSQFSDDYYDNYYYHPYHDQLYKCRGGIGTYYIIPSLLHFVAFVLVLRQMRAPELDPFHNLCILNYILISKINGGQVRASHRLTSVIRKWLLFGIICLVLAIISHMYHLFFITTITTTAATITSFISNLHNFSGNTTTITNTRHTTLRPSPIICFTFFQPQSHRTYDIMKIICFVLFSIIDFASITIFTTYAVVCELNVIFLKGNITALREKRINFRVF